MAPIPREIVAFNGNYKAGTIVVSTAERRLYFVMPNGEALRYGVGVGPPGLHLVRRQDGHRQEGMALVDPAGRDDRPPSRPAALHGGRRRESPRCACHVHRQHRYRIHGSNEPDTIGQAVSSGCIRMTNEDVTDLYERVKVGAKVVVLN